MKNKRNREGLLQPVPETIQHYIEELLPEREALFTEMEQYAAEHRIPIIEPVSMEAVLQVIKLRSPMKVLEIGAAIGYSAIRFAKALPECQVVTMERDKARYEVATTYIKKAGLHERICLLEGDAFDVVEKIKTFAPFDLLFIDAAKAQYRRFFETFAPFLTKQGLVITDNVLFRGLVADQTVEQKRFRNLVKKIRAYNQWIMQHPDYETMIYPVGDGIAISKKK